MYKVMAAVEIGTTDRHTGDHRLEEFRNRAKVLVNRIREDIDEKWVLTQCERELFIISVAATASRKHFVDDNELNRLAKESKRIASREQLIFEDE